MRFSHPILSASFLLTALLVASEVTAQPTARVASRMVYATHLDRIVLFGGLTDPDSSNLRYELNDTWEWTGLRWIPVYTQQSPDARSSHAMAYNPIRREVVLFGGSNLHDTDPRGDATYFGDTWVYRNRDWVRIESGSAPSARGGSALVYDPSRNRMILFGGQTADTLIDTWEFDGTSWTQLDTNGPKLLSPLLVRDDARGDTLLLGYNAEAKEAQMYRLSGSTWSRITTAKIPPCVQFGALVYQQHNERVLFVGGQCANTAIEDETWEWDGSDWTEIKPPVSQGSLAAHALAYDAQRQETILFGGQSFGAASATQRYRDGRWTFALGSFSPGPRSLAVFEHDPIRGVFWLYGGVSDDGPYTDFWKLTGSTWERVVVADTPVDCDYPVGTWDTERNRLVVVCSNSNVHEWDGERWFKFLDLKPSPDDRQFSSLTYDGRNKRTLLFGGYGVQQYYKETWSWDGSRWTRLAKDKKSPSNRGLASMFYDPKSQRVILFGGIGRKSLGDQVDRFGDMWSWDGSAWTEITTGTKPPARYGAQVEYNPVSQKTVLFGGKSGEEQYLNDQWEFDGSVWTQVNVASRPSPRMNGAFAYDVEAQRFLLFGGYAGRYFSELWSLQGADWRIQTESLGRTRRSAPTPPARPAKTGETNGL